MSAGRREGRALEGVGREGKKGEKERSKSYEDEEEDDDGEEEEEERIRGDTGQERRSGGAEAPGSRVRRRRTDLRCGEGRETRSRDCEGYTQARMHMHIVATE